MLAYLAMMAPRLTELRRVLKPTGSIYLHCDPSASHYLEMVMDAVFWPEQFRNEIVWKRTSAHSSARRYGPVHDVILFYGRSDDMKWIGGTQAYDEDYVKQRYVLGDDRPWRAENLTGAGIRHGETGAVWRGFDVTAKGRHWAYPPSELDKLDAVGLIYWPDKKGGWPRQKKFLDEAKGVPLQDVVSALDSEALLERIISASSNEGDTVLDPFCGCGTTIAAAQKLNRRWIGIDITNLAIALIRGRLTDTFGGTAEYEVIGEPVSLPDARKLAHDDPYQFQWWALGLVGARPVEEKKGADKGIDGRIYFHVGENKTRQIILSVKAGHVNVSHVRDLRGVLDREKAEIGALISVEEPTGPMRKEAASAGFYTSPWGKHARLQLITIEDLLTGRTIDRPPIQTSVTFKRAPKAVPKVRERRRLNFDSTEPEQPF